MIRTATKPVDTRHLDELADRIRQIVEGDPRITEKRMFGGLTFLLNGRIMVGAKKDGRILANVGRDGYAAALARDGVEAMAHNGRAMTGYVWVDGGAIDEDATLREWVSICERAAAAMPIK